MDVRNDTQIATYIDIVSSELEIIGNLTGMLISVQRDIHMLNIEELEDRIHSLVASAEKVESIENKRDAIYKGIRSLYGLDADGEFSDIQTHIDAETWEELEVLYRKLKISILQFRSQLNILVLYFKECESIKRDLLDEFFPDNHDSQYTKSGVKSDQLHAGLLCDWST